MLVGGGFNAVCVLLYYMITVQRKQKYVLIGYVGAALAAFLLGDRMVAAYGLLGASLTYLLSVILLCLLFIGIFTTVLLKKRKGEKQLG